MEYHPLLHLSGNQPRQIAKQFSIFYSALLIVSWSPGKTTPYSSASYPSSISATLQASSRARERRCRSLETKGKGKLRLHSLFQVGALCSWQDAACHIHDPSQLRPVNTLLLIWTTPQLKQFQLQLSPNVNRRQKFAGYSPSTQLICLRAAFYHWGFIKGHTDYLAF